MGRGAVLRFKVCGSSGFQVRALRSVGAASPEKQNQELAPAKAEPFRTAAWRSRSTHGSLVARSCALPSTTPRLWTQGINANQPRAAEERKERAPLRYGASEPLRKAPRRSRSTPGNGKGMAEVHPRPPRRSPDNPSHRLSAALRDRVKVLGRLSDGNNEKEPLIRPAPAGPPSPAGEGKRIAKTHPRPPRRSPDTLPYRLSAVLRDRMKVVVASREEQQREETPHPSRSGW
jgi:hypothetical protein